MAVVYKYPVKPGPEGYFELELPRAALFMKVEEQHGVPQMWWLVAEPNVTRKRRFRIVGTGHDFDLQGFRPLGTFLGCDGALVWHLFLEEKTEDAIADAFASMFRERGGAG